MHVRLDRRDFLYCSLASAAPFVVRRRPRSLPFRLALRIPAGDAVRPPWLDAARRGAAFGAEEAAHTYALLRREMQLLEGTEAAGVADAVVSLLDDAAACAQADADAIDGRTGPPLIDARAHYGHAQCDALFRIGLGDDAWAAALAYSVSDAPVVAAVPAAGTLPEAPSTPRVVLWHPALSRYGAAQLNERYARRFGQPMDEHAWAAWMAVKIVTEAGLRARGAAAGALSGWLTRARAGFDGHKGAPLFFDARRRLLQPVYRVAGDRILQLPHPATDIDHDR